MSDSKRLVVSLYDTLKEDRKKKSQFIMKSIILYIERSKSEYIENMKNGYMEMASINLEFSEMSCAYDLEDCVEYETWLSESDMSNDNNGSKKRRYILC